MFPDSQASIPWVPFFFFRLCVVYLSWQSPRFPMLTCRNNSGLPFPIGSWFPSTSSLVHIPLGYVICPFLTHVIKLNICCLLDTLALGKLGASHRGPSLAWLRAGQENTVWRGSQEPQETRSHYPKICLFGTRIILSWPWEDIYRHRRRWDDTEATSF